VRIADQQCGTEVVGSDRRELSQFWARACLDEVRASPRSRAGRFVTKGDQRSGRLWLWRAGHGGVDRLLSELQPHTTPQARGMVWVLTGQVQNRPEGKPSLLHAPTKLRADPLLVVVDEAGVVPAETQHWLRPNRSYRLGRMAHTAKPPKPGTKGAEIKPKMVDFALKSTSVSKDGAWEVRCEGQDWDEVSCRTLTQTERSNMCSGR
jgi:hypothetical protein